MSDDVQVNWSLNFDDKMMVYYVEFDTGWSFGFSPRPDVNIHADDVDTIELREPLYDKFVEAVHDKDEWPLDVSASVEYGPTPHVHFVTEDEVIEFEPKVEAQEGRAS